MSRAQITLGASDDTGGAFAAVRGKLDALGRQAQGVSAAFAGVSGTIAAVLGGVSLGVFVRDLAVGVDQLNDLKDATGASIGNLSALEDVAARTGTSFQTVGSALVKFNAALAGAKPGTEAAEVFKRLGLSVAELKNLDPAEAFRQTAVALSRFADDGNKARAVQELFGKSLREVAPLLNDVAKAGELVAKVTDEQANQAEKFNHQLDALSKNSLDAKRALLGDLLPGLNKVLAAFTQFQAAQGLGIGTAALEVLKGNSFADAADGVVFYGKKLADLRGQFKIIAETSQGVARRGALIDLSKDIESAEKLEGYYRRLNRLTAADNGQTDPRELARRGRLAGGTESIGDINKPEKTRDQVSELDKYLQKLREALLATQGISAAEQARIDINRGLLGVLDQATQSQVIGLADALDRIKVRADSEKAFNALREEGRRLTESLRTEEEKFSELLDRSNVLVAAGAISWGTYARASTSALEKSLENVEKLWSQLPKLGKRLNEVTEETKAFSSQLNNALGDSILAAFEGSTSRIGDVWKNLIKRMAAQALQAQLSTLLFGEGYGTTSNQVGGVFGGIGQFLGGLGGGARADGGPVRAGRPYLVGERGPEIVVPGQAGTVLPNGTAMAAAAAPVYTINVQGDASENTLRLINAALANFQARQMRGA
jgi:hypothetical protein